MLVTDPGFLAWKCFSPVNNSMAKVRKRTIFAAVAVFLTGLCYYKQGLEVTDGNLHLQQCPTAKEAVAAMTKAKFRAKGRKALVTGAAGFIGSHVAKDVAALGFDTVALDDMSGGFERNVPEGVRLIVGDLKDAKFVAELFDKEQFDVVFHLAAYAAEGLSHFIRNYNYQNNLIASTNLITQAVRVGSVKRFVFTSSIAVYGAGRTPMTEDLQPAPEDPYGISKFAVELDLKAAQEMWGLDFVVFRPHNVYGPGQNMYDRYRNVIGIFLNQLQAGKQLTVFGDGLQTRKFSYISDVSYPIALAGVLDTVSQQVFNVGGDIATTVNELATVTAEAWGAPDANVLHLDARNEVAHAESDHKKLNCFFPGLPKAVGLRDGMQRMVKWAKTDGKYFPPVEFKAVEVLRKMPPSWVAPGMGEVPAFVHDSSDNVVSNAMSEEAKE
jgi:UDP-glucose 4-epimerase